jgi:hypothetical protein
MEQLRRMQIVSEFIGEKNQKCTHAQWLPQSKSKRSRGIRIIFAIGPTAECAYQQARNLPVFALIYLTLNINLFCATSVDECIFRTN